MKIFSVNYAFDGEKRIPRSVSVNLSSVEVDFILKAVEKLPKQADVSVESARENFYSLKNLYCHG